MEKDESMGMSLLKKGQKGIMHIIFSRLGLIVFMLVIQVLVMFGIFYLFEETLPYFYGGAMLFSACMVLYLLNSRIDHSAQITWLIVIMLLPIFGSLLFWYTQSDLGHRALKRRLNQLIIQTKESIPQSETVMETLHEEAPETAALAHYIHRTGCYPVYDQTDVTYFPSGEEKWEEMLRQLKQAKHFIFMEYFIVDEGLMWGKVLEILAEKVKEGVEVSGDV